MFIVRPQHLEALNAQSLSLFEDEMIEMSRKFAPPHCEALGDISLREAVRSAIRRARSVNFTKKGPIRLYIQLGFLFGSSFDTDPQYAWAGKLIRRSTPEMDRAEEVHKKTADYHEKVHGPGSVHAKQALVGLADLAQRPIPFSTRDFVPGMLRELVRLFPQKADYVGDDALRVILEKAQAESRTRRFPSPRGEGLLATLMFAFGHGCLDDPLFPWIKRTLDDSRIVSPEARSQRLEKKSITWLNHVLASFPGGS